MLERLSVKVLHGDEGVAGIFADVVDGADVGVVQCGSGLGFAAEAGEGLGIFGDVVRKKLEGHEAVQAGVFRFVNDAHATAAKFFEDTIVGNGLANQ